ncbi:MAG: type transport system permease protein [Thermoleophilaceae bacterium]|nr:type transport system permease protein [Thermoleophilaceae bacterium]
MSGALAIAGYALRESTRRRVFVVVLLLTAAFLVLYGIGTEAAFDSVDAQAAGAVLNVDDQVLTGSTLLGLAMFTTLFLGCVLAVFLTLGAVRGDAERGLLQPLVVRPLGRTALLGGRFAAAAGVCAAYVATVYTAATVITGLSGGWWPADPVSPGLGLVMGVILIAALSLLGSIFLSANANGIAVFMAFGAGLAAGLLGQIGDALNVDTLKNVAEVASWVLPFEALYQGGLNSLTESVGGNTALIVQLGPFGGAQEAGPLLWPWSVAYLLLLAAAARAAFARRDL